MKLSEMHAGAVYLQRGGGGQLYLWTGETAQETQYGYSHRKVTRPMMRHVYTDWRRQQDEPGFRMYDLREPHMMDQGQLLREYAPSLDEAIARHRAENDAENERRTAIRAIREGLRGATGLSWDAFGSLNHPTFTISLQEEQAKMYLAERKRGSGDQ